MRIALLGANSTLAHYISRFLAFDGFGRRNCKYITNYSIKDLKDKLKGYDVVINLVGKYKGKKEDIWNANVSINNNVLEAINEDQLYVYASSISVYGKKAIQANEKTSLNPDTIYAKAKARAEQLIQKKHKNALILRIGTLYGGKYRVYCKMLNYIRKGYILMPGNGSYYVPFTYAMDVASSIAYAIKNMKTGIYVLASPSQKLIDVMNYAKSLLNPKARTFFIPKSLLLLLSNINEKIYFSSYLDKETVLSLTSSRTFNSEKAKKALAFRSTPIKEGIKNTIKECGFSK